jgi:putative endonuclease
MFYIYILQSLEEKRIYIGYTNNLKRRVREHNARKDTSTKHRAPYRLVYYEAYHAQSDAKRRERNLKRFAQAYTQLRKRTEDSIRHSG